MTRALTPCVVASSASNAASRNSLKNTTVSPIFRTSMNAVRHAALGISQPNQFHVSQITPSRLPYKTHSVSR